MEEADSWGLEERVPSTYLQCARFNFAKTPSIAAYSKGHYELNEADNSPGIKPLIPEVAHHHRLEKSLLQVSIRPSGTT